MIEIESQIINIVFHGRGGQGCVTASQIMVEAAYLSGNFVDVHAYPSFGAERRGAPVQAYAKLSRQEKIWDRSQITNPDILIVLDETVLDQDIASSLKENGIFIINSEKNPEFFATNYNLDEQSKIIVADISNMAFERDLTIEGLPVVNIPILGLLSKALPELSLDNLKKIVLKRLGEQLGKRNYELMEEGYKISKTL